MNECLTDFIWETDLIFLSWRRGDETRTLQCASWIRRWKMDILERQFISHSRCSHHHSSVCVPYIGTRIVASFMCISVEPPLSLLVIGRTPRQSSRGRGYDVSLRVTCLRLSWSVSDSVTRTETSSSSSSSSQLLYQLYEHFHLLETFIIPSEEVCRKFVYQESLIWSASGFIWTLRIWTFMLETLETL